MIDPPTVGGGIRTRDLVVESGVQDTWAIPVIPGTKKMTLGPVDLFGPKQSSICDFGALAK